jgi:ATP-dependent helicase/nuclease subunit A
VERELVRLRERRYLTPEQPASVNPANIRAHFASPRGRRLCAAAEVQREFKFLLLTGADAADTPDALTRAPANGEDGILFQGVIDCFFREGEDLILVDFKTDFVPDGQEHAVAERYRAQLAAYAAALTRITGRRVTERHVYLFGIDGDVMIDNI